MRFLLLSLSIACTASKVDETDSGGDTDPPSETPTTDADGSGGDDGAPNEDCESDSGTLEGQILLDLEWGSGPEIAAFGKVTVTPSDGVPITILSDEEGRFTTPLPANEYLIMAEGGSCVSDQFSINLEACETETHTLRLIDCILGDADTGMEEDGEGGDTTGGEEGGDTTGGEEGGDTTGGEEGGDTTGGEEDGDTTGGEEGGDTTGGEEGGDTTGGEEGGDTTGGEEGGDTDFSTSICTSEEPDMFDVSALAWDGDVLVVSVGYGGCTDGRPFTPCWDGEWDRGMPPGATLDLEMLMTDEMCMMYVMEDIRIDVSSIIASAEARSEADTFQIYVAGMSIEYRF